MSDIESHLTIEQQRRVEALKAARQTMSGLGITPDKLVEAAGWILGAPEPAPGYDVLSHEDIPLVVEDGAGMPDEPEPVEPPPAPNPYVDPVEVVVCGGPSEVTLLREIAPGPVYLNVFSPNQARGINVRSWRMTKWAEEAPAAARAAMVQALGGTAAAS
jgi:hypothetical protein